MKHTGLIFGFGAAFYALVTVVYFIFTREVIGTILLLLTGGMTLIIAFYLLVTIRRLGDQPEDSQLAEQDELDPDYGFFSPHSWWPLPVAAAAALTGAGLVYARWMIALGALILVLSLIGLVFEYTPFEYNEVENAPHGH
jgi:hypothetical protein